MDSVTAQRTAGQGITEYYFAYAKDAADKRAYGMRGGAGGSGAKRRSEGGEAPAVAAAPANSPQAFGSPPMTQKAEAATETESLAAGRQRYAILADKPMASLKSENAPAQTEDVLATFDLEMSGNRLRIIDADGSVYEGVLEDRGNFAIAPPARAIAGATFTNSRAGKAPSLGTSRPTEAKGARGQLQMTFQASGTSRHLGQPVTITGTIVNVAKSQALAEREKAVQEEQLKERTATLDTAISKAVQGGRLPKTPAKPATVEALKIEGFVRVGTGPERPLNAVRVEK
jgi:hypothetical protein